ncbi:putative N-acetyltransferase YvbK [Thalassovita autumnalis]|uniref:N-acetyltransferase YvbK n=1 Tax=Thalassovita autumnalis TaxID=2072972 RepID=A0A0P1F8K7_9RHOB|nr:putative N-acetyltransferase YvbK [Thalassovita autumnalis]CUH74357.1 putative N-acetyltransferase YvbK [Thalassovita autumnalis]
MAGLIDAAYQPYRDCGLVLPDVSGGLDEAIAAGQVWVIGEVPLGVLMMATTPPDAHLMNIAVSAAAKGQGIGGQLIRFALDHARATGCSRMALATHKDIPENVALYEHLGWQVTARDGMKVLMSRDL